MRTAWPYIWLVWYGTHLKHQNGFYGRVESGLVDRFYYSFPYNLPFSTYGGRP